MTRDEFWFWFGVWTSILLLGACGTISFTDWFSPEVASKIAKACAALAAINNVVLTAAKYRGYLDAKTAAIVPIAATVAKVLIAAFALSFLVANGSAMAATIKPLKTAPVATATDPLGKFMADLAQVKQEIVDGVVADITAADTDASMLLNPADPTSFKDPISHACYPAEMKFLQSLPVATAPTGKFVLVQLFQKKRDFVMQIQAGLPVYLKLGCAPLLGDEAQILTKSMALIGVQVGLNALVPGMGLALPAL
jgi:hypothetical protein